MNDHRASAELRREIVLAKEPPFLLAHTAVRPPALEVEFQSETTPLEPRVMKVLVVLGRMGGQPVSRELLTELCWAGRVVTDGALNRSIAQLRKALRDPGIQIETIPTVGYRLLAAPETGATAIAAGEPASLTVAERVAAEGAAAKPADVERAATQATPATGTAPASTSTPASASVPAGASVLPPLSTHTSTPGSASAKRLSRALLMIAGLLVLALGIYWLVAPTRALIWTASEFRPLTSTADQETYPALSPDGTQIVYSTRPDAYSARDLYLRNVEDGTPIQLTSDPGDDFGAAWSPDGSRIAFVRATDDHPCALLVVPAPGGPERVVTTCLTSVETRPSWLNLQTLVFSDRLATEPVSRIRAVDIESGAVRDLTSPAGSTMGDSDPQASPDGRHIAFRRSLAVGADDLLALDVQLGQEHAVTTDGWKASGYVWSSDSGSIFFASNRGGDFGLWSAEVGHLAPPRRVSLGLGTVSFTRMSADRRNRIAVEFSRAQNKLARVSDRGEVEVITAGAGSDGDPSVGPDGSVAHVSNRGGSYELWLLRNGNAASRLTSIQGSYVLEPSWSRDGTRIAFVGVKGREAEVYTVGRDGSKLRRLTNDGVAKRDPVFASSGDRVHYLARVDGAWQLMELELKGPGTPRAVPGSERWVTLRAAPDGTIFGRQEGEDSVRRINPPAGAAGSGTPSDLVVESSPHISDADAWTVGKDGIYVRRGRRMEHASSLWFYPWLGEGRKLAEVPLASGNIAVDLEGRILVSQSTSAEVDLAMLELQAQN